jgi:hypothetical protein
MHITKVNFFISLQITVVNIYHIPKFIYVCHWSQFFYKSIYTKIHINKPYVSKFSIYLRIYQNWYIKYISLKQIYIKRYIFFTVECSVSHSRKGWERCGWHCSPGGSSEGAQGQRLRRGQRRRYHWRWGRGRRWGQGRRWGTDEDRGAGEDDGEGNCAGDGEGDDKDNGEGVGADDGEGEGEGADDSEAWTMVRARARARTTTWGTEEAWRGNSGEWNFGEEEERILVYIR